MRYAIVSDIHANLQAWNAVLLDIRSLDVDAIICLGDVVGYGPNPAEVLESVHSHVDFLVLGNHDAVVCGKMSADGFNDTASEAIAWTIAHLGPNARTFLATLPLTLRHEDFRFAHGDFSEPGSFNYIIDPDDAVPSWGAVREPVLFVGHTHRPAIFVLGESGTPRITEPQDFLIEPEKRFIVNVGSVGQPRTPDTRSSYCILDTQARSVCWRFVPFDLDAYKAAADAAGLPAAASAFLQHDPRKGVRPLREMLGFSPPAVPERGLRDTVAVAELAKLKGKVRQWRLVTGALLAAVVLGLAGAGAAMVRHRGRAVSVPHVVAWTDHERGERPVPLHWTAQIGNRYRQSCRRGADETGTAVLVWRSGAGRDGMRLTSAALAASAGDRFLAETRIRKGSDFRGNLALVVSIEQARNGRIVRTDQFVVKEPNLPRKDGWLKAQRTFELPADTQSMQLELRARFKGTVEVGPTRLLRK